MNRPYLTLRKGEADFILKSWMFANIIVFLQLASAFQSSAIPLSVFHCELNEPATRHLRDTIEAAYGRKILLKSSDCAELREKTLPQLKSFQSTVLSLSSEAISTKKINQFAMDLWEQSMGDLIITRVDAEMRFNDGSNRTGTTVRPETFVSELCIDPKENHENACLSGFVSPGAHDRLTLIAKNATAIYRQKKILAQTPSRVALALGRRYTAHTAAARLVNQVKEEAFTEINPYSDTVNSQTQKINRQNSLSIQNSSSYQKNFQRAITQGKKIESNALALDSDAREVDALLFTPSLKKKTFSQGIRRFSLDSPTGRAKTSLIPERVSEVEAARAIKEYRAAPAVIGHEMSRDLILARMPGLGQPNLNAAPLTGWINRMMSLHPLAVAKLIKRQPEYGSLLCLLLKEKDAAEAINKKLEATIESAMFATVLVSGGSLAPALLGLELSASAAAQVGSILAVNEVVGSAAMGASFLQHLETRADLSQKLDFLEVGILSHTGVKVSDVQDTKKEIAQTETDLAMDSFFISTPYLSKFIGNSIQEGEIAQQLSQKMTPFTENSLATLGRQFKNSPRTKAALKFFSIFCGISDAKCGILMSAFHGLSPEKQIRVLTEPKELEAFTKRINQVKEITAADEAPHPNADVPNTVLTDPLTGKQIEERNRYVSYTDPETGTTYHAKIIGYETKGNKILPKLMYPSGAIQTISERTLALLSPSEASQARFKFKNSEFLSKIEKRDLNSTQSYISYTHPNTGEIVYAKIIGYQVKEAKVVPKIIFTDGSTRYLDEERLSSAMMSSNSKSVFENNLTANRIATDNGKMIRVTKDVKDLPIKKNQLIALNELSKTEYKKSDLTKARKIKLQIVQKETSVDPVSGVTKVTRVIKYMDGYLLSEGTEGTKIGKLAASMDRNFRTKLIYSEDANKATGANAYYSGKANIFDEYGKILFKDQPIINAYKTTLEGKNSDTNIHELGHMKTNANSKAGKVDPLAIYYSANPGETLPNLPNRQSFYLQSSQADESRQHAMNFWNATHQRVAAEVKLDFQTNKQLKISEAFGVTTKNFLDAMDEGQTRLTNLQTLNYRGIKMNTLALEAIEKNRTVETVFTLTSDNKFARIKTSNGNVRIPIVGETYEKYFKNLSDANGSPLSAEHEATLKNYLAEYLDTSLSVFNSQKAALFHAEKLLNFIKENPDLKIDYPKFLEYQDKLGRVKTSVNFKKNPN